MRVLGPTQDIQKPKTTKSNIAKVNEKPTKSDDDDWSLSAGAEVPGGLALESGGVFDRRPTQASRGRPKGAVVVVAAAETSRSASSEDPQGAAPNATCFFELQF